MSFLCNKRILSNKSYFITINNIGLSLSLKSDAASTTATCLVAGSAAISGALGTAVLGVTAASSQVCTQATNAVCKVKIKNINVK